MSVYGIIENSSYVEISELEDLKKNVVYFSKPFSDKYGLKTGDSITLDEKYENKQYVFSVAGIYDRSHCIAVFMSLENFGQIFELEKDEFSSFLSESELTDVEDEYIATVITERQSLL